MSVQVLFFDGCPNHDALLRRLRDLIAQAGMLAQVELVCITSDGQAQAARFLGSPTVRIGGADVEPGAEQRTDFGLKCRLYYTATGLSGMPDDAWIRDALAAHA